MKDKVDLAPVDKHAVDPREAAKLDKKTGELRKGLEDSFPASDPVSLVQPAPSVHDSGDKPGGEKHPGMMGDGTEEQNLGQKGNPKARITEDEVKAAFEKK